MEFNLQSTIEIFNNQTLLNQCKKEFIDLSLTDNQFRNKLISNYFNSLLMIFAEQQNKFHTSIDPNEHFESQLVKCLMIYFGEQNKDMYLQENVNTNIQKELTIKSLPNKLVIQASIAYCFIIFMLYETDKIDTLIDVIDFLELNEDSEFIDTVNEIYDSIPVSNIYPIKSMDIRALNRGKDENALLLSTSYYFIVTPDGNIEYDMTVALAKITKANISKNALNNKFWDTLESYGKQSETHKIGTETNFSGDVHDIVK